IGEAEIPSEATRDIVSDYWNKLASIAWEATLLEDQDKREPWLKQARMCINVALEGRPNWTPGQLNLARIHAAEGDVEKALAILERIIGKEDTAKQTVPVAEVPQDNSDAIISLITKMAVERNPTAVAGHILRCYGPLSRESVRKVTEAVAGKVDG